MQQTSSQLRSKTNDVEVLAAAIEEMQQCEALHAVQTKAITHRLQSLEAELQRSEALRVKEMQAVQLSHDSQLQRLTSTHRDETAACSASALAQLKAVSDRLLETHSTQLRAVEALLAQEKSEREALCSAAREEREHLVQTAKLREEQMLEQMQQAVKEAKNRVYEKAKLQFETGNKEYTKLKQQFKALGAEKEALVAEVDKSRIEAAKLSSEFEALQRSKEAADKLLLQSSKGSAELTELVLRLLGPADAAVAGTADKLELAKASVGLHHRQSNEAQTERENLCRRLREAELQLELREAQAETQRGRVLALETDVAKALGGRAEVERELEELKKERDAQMTVVARLMVDKANAAAAPSSSGCDGSCVATLAAVRRTNVELEERCVGLRAMNEEVLGMLEKVQGL